MKKLFARLKSRINGSNTSRTNVSHENGDKRGDTLKPLFPSVAQLDGNVSHQDISKAPNNIVDDPGHAGHMSGSHTNIDRAGDALNPVSPSDVQLDAHVDSKDISRPPNDIGNNPDDNARSNNPAEAAFSVWLEANQDILALITEAIKSLDNPNVDAPGLHKYLSYGDLSKVLLRGLKLFADCHPVTQVVFASFEVVAAIGTLYQENNQKVAIIRLRMQDLLIAIFQLRDLKDTGTSPTGSITEAMKRIAKDIKRAAAACDLYMKKKLIIRVIKSLQYESIFVNEIAQLVRAQENLMTALQIHTARTTSLLYAELKVIRKMSEAQLRLLDTPREKSLQEFLKDHGGANMCIEDGSALRELLEKSGEGIEGVLGHQLGPNESWSEVQKKVQKELRKEIAEDIKEVFNKSFEQFTRTLDLQGQQLTDIKKGNDKIMDALNAGPQAHSERILDGVFKQLWRDMAWRKNVYAQRFVSALYEHLIENMDANDENQQWTQEYLNCVHLQPLIEVLDDDATGYITTREINNFVGSKLEDWSLLQWIAYWAAGWQLSVTRYKSCIYKLISEMFSVYPQVLPANRDAVIMYLQDKAIFDIDKLLQSTRSSPPNVFKSVELHRLTERFTKVEEQRLMDKLQSVRYDIYSTYMVFLVTGRGHIERYIYPMLYVLLRRHYGVLNLSTTKILDPDEIYDMRTSLRNVFSVVDERLENLESSFVRSQVNFEEKLENFAFCMFKIYHDNPKKEPSKNAIAKYIYEQSIYDDNVEPLEVTPDDLLYRTFNEASSYSSCSFPVAPSKYPIQGQWVGHISNAHRSFGLVQLSIESSPEGILTGEAVKWQYTMEISGKIEQNNRVEIRLDFENDGSFDWEDLTGRLDAEKSIIKGRWGEDDSAESSEEEDTDEEAGSTVQQGELDATEKIRSGADLESCPDRVDAASQGSPEDDCRYTFVLRRTSASCQFLPNGLLGFSSAAESRASARAQWSFALKCVRDQIRRKNSPGRCFMERFAKAGRFIVLARRKIYTDKDYCPRLKPLSEKEEEELERLKCTICPEISRLCYASVTDAIDRRKYGGYGCDSCGGDIVGSRWACVTCMNDSFTDRIDLCASCVKESVKLRGFVHDASHVLLKCDTFVLDAHWQWIIPQARSLVVKIKKEFRSRSKKHTELDQSSLPDNSIQPKDTSTITESPTCQKCKTTKVSLPCWVRITSYWRDSDDYLCEKCGSNSKPPAIDSPGFGRPLLRIDDNDPLEAVTMESRLTVLEEKLVVMMKLMEKVADNLLPGV